MVAVMRLPVGPHPRSHGENGMFTPPVYSFAGSSPLTRGKPDLPAHDSHRSGLIPAHAGKTSSFYAMLAPCRDHPRSRGENNRRRVVAWARPGSSPLTRGNMNGQLGNLVGPGSSPLTRGKHSSCALLRDDAGLIPAHAGKTVKHAPIVVSSPAHPRSRGENVSIVSPPSLSAGSSPLTRGKRLDRQPTELIRGLIPAHAGKTRPCRWRARRLPAHPRSRGENQIASPICRMALGSSPLTRGKLTHDRHVCRPPGLIPTHAGKTICRVFALVAPGAHPRSRGENRGLGVAGLGVHGSSPLTRGKRA